MVVEAPGLLSEGLVFVGGRRALDLQSGGPGAKWWPRIRMRFAPGTAVVGALVDLEAGVFGGVDDSQKRSEMGADIVGQQGGVDTSPEGSADDLSG